LHQSQQGRRVAAKQLQNQAADCTGSRALLLQLPEVHTVQQARQQVDHLQQQAYFKTRKLQGDPVLRLHIQQQLAHICSKPRDDFLCLVYMVLMALSLCHTLVLHLTYLMPPHVKIVHAFYSIYVPISRAMCNGARIVSVLLYLASLTCWPGLQRQNFWHVKQLRSFLPVRCTLHGLLIRKTNQLTCKLRAD